MSDSRCMCLIACIAGLTLTLGCGDSDSSKQQQTKFPNGSPDFTNRMPEVEATLTAVSSRVDELFRAISDGQVQRVYEEFTSPKFREAATFEKFKSICDRVTTRLGRLQKKESSRFDMDPVENTFIASATYEATFDLGSGTLFVVFQKQDDKWLLLRLNVNAPELLDDPKTFQQPTEIYVENSEPVMPGTMVDLLDTAVNPPKVVVQNVRVLYVRWKLDDPSKPPHAPATGFVTIGLKLDQTDAVKQSKTLSVRSHN